MRSVWMTNTNARAMQRYAPPGMSVIPGAWNAATPRRYMGRGVYQQAGDFLGIGKLVHNLASSSIGSVLKMIPGVGQVVNYVDAGAQLLAGSDKRSKQAGPGGSTALVAAGAGMALPSLAGMLSAGGGMSVAPPDPTYTDPGTIAQISRNAGITSAPAGTAGYHLNKTGYWVNGSALIPGAHYVAKGTKWVKNRKRNPFNPRAASRSMSRLAGLSHGMKALEKNLRRLAPHPRHAAAPRQVGRKR